MVNIGNTLSKTTFTLFDNINMILYNYIYNLTYK